MPRLPVAPQASEVATYKTVAIERSAPRLRNELAAGIVEQTGDLVFVTNVEGVIEYVNPAFERVTGYSSADAVGAQPRLLKSGHHDAEFYNSLWTTLLDGRIFRGTLVNRRKSGEEFLSEQTISPIRAKNGRIKHLVSVGRDVTESRRAAEREQRMQLARAMQQRFYPTRAPEHDGFEIAGAAWPADSTGGDYFDYLTLPGGALGVVVGDVSGHGYDSALLMSETRAYMRSTAFHDDNPGRILTRVNHALSLDVPENRYVSMLLVRLDPVRRSLTFVNAGHEKAFLIDGVGGVKLELASQQFPLGLFADTRYRTSPATPFAIGDTLVLVTDGVIEPENGRGESFGRERLLCTVGEARGLPARETVQRVRDAVVGFAGRERLADDLTVVVCRFV